MAAISADIFKAPADLVIPASSYTTGGTLLGERLAMIPVGITKHIEMLTKQVTGIYPVETRTFGMSATLKFVLAERTTDVVGLLFDIFATGKNVKGRNSIKLGNINVDAAYTKILVRPKNPLHPFFFVPRGMVVDFQAIVWDDHVKHLEATEITILTTLDTAGEPFYYGDPATFPAL